MVISETLRHGLRVGIMVAITPLLTDFPVMLVAINSCIEGHDYLMFTPTICMLHAENKDNL